jgi:type III secretion protein D
MLELRILTGLQRGAAMAIEDAQILTVGSGDNCDVLILDHGIAEQHLTLEYQEEALVLTPLEEVRGDDGDYITEAIVVERLHLFYLKGIWIGIADTEDDWSIFDELIPEKIPDSNLELVAEGEEYHIEPIKMSWKSKLFAVAGLLMLASWATASVFIPKDSALKPTSSTKKQASGALVENKDGRADESLNPIKKVTIAKKYYSREELAEIINSKLMELQLRTLVDLKYDVEGWTIEASLDDEDRLRLERALEWFNAEYKPRFPITVKILNLANFLPFKVTQIVSGKMAGVITEDGQRFFVGDTVDGYRLVSVQGNKATFDGKRKIDIVL